MTQSCRSQTAAKMKLKTLILASILQVCVASAEEPADSERQDLAADLVSQGVEAYAEGRYADAAAHYRESLQLWDNDQAGANLCNLLLYGQGAEQDYVEARRLCASAAKKGNPNAFVMLGEMYLLGKGVVVDKEAAMVFYRGGAERGHSHGQFVLGAILADAGKPEGIEWLTKAADQGHAGAIEYLESKKQQASE